MVTVEQKGSAFYINGILEKEIKIPSQMFPLTGEVYCINPEETEDFPENATTDKIREIYNSINPGVGLCYHNIDTLITELKKEGIEATPMVGWCFVGEELPVHHCFAIIDNHILDFNPNMEFFFKEEFAGLGLEKTREMITDLMIELRSKPNSETTTFGKLNRFTHYFASPCKPLNGIKVYQKLIKTYPKHPCHKNVNSNGMNKTQEMFYDRIKK